MEPIHRSAPRVRGKNQNSVSGLDLGRRVTDEIQPVNVAGAATHELVFFRGDNPADQSRQFLCQLGEDIGESSLLRQRKINHFGLREHPSHAEKLYCATDGFTVYPVRGRTQLTPSLQGSLVIVGRIHIEKTQPFRIETADYVLVNLTGLNFIEKINGPQFAAVQLSFEQREYLGAV